MARWKHALRDFKVKWQHMHSVRKYKYDSTIQCALRFLFPLFQLFLLKTDPLSSLIAEVVTIWAGEIPLMENLRGKTPHTFKKLKLLNR